VDLASAAGPGGRGRRRLTQGPIHASIRTGLIFEGGQAILAADGLGSTVSIILDAARRLAGAERRNAATPRVQACGPMG